MSAARDMGEHGGARVVAVTAGARGMGRSTIASNLAAAAARRGRRVCLLDASHAQGSDATLLDVAAGRARLCDALAPRADGVDGLVLAPAGRRAPARVPEACLLAHVDALEGRYDLVLVDAPTLAQPYGAFFAGAATDVVVVTTPDEPALHQAETHVRVLGARCGRHELLLVATGCRDAAAASEVERALGALGTRPPHVRVEPLGWIPYDASVAQARRARRALAADAPAARALDALAARLLARRPARPTGAAQFFFQSLIAQGRAA